MTYPPQKRSTRLLKHFQRGFSLVEMLVVISILAVLMGVVASISTNTLTSIDLRTTAGQVASMFTRAREEALVKNANVQVRIYKTDRESFDGEPKYGLIAIGIVNAPSDPDDPAYNDPQAFPFEPIAKRYSLPQSVSLMDSSPYSTIITDTHSKGTEEIPHLGTLEYSAITFTPNNRATLSSSQEWTLTIIQEADEAKGVLPSNYITMQLFPTTGRLDILQP